MIEKDTNGFVLRIAPSEVDRIQLALDTNSIIIGWSAARGLLQKGLKWDDFRQILTEAYSDYRDHPRRAGAAAGNMWRFIYEMKVGDLVVVPHHSNFYVARIEGDVQHFEDKVEEDTAFRRPVEWLNGKRPIARDQAQSALYSRMKVRQTSAWATDLLPDIESVLGIAAKGIRIDFAQQLTEDLTKSALKQMQTGLMNERAFERLVALILQRLGGVTKITPRIQDKGDDIVASFKRLGIEVVAQVKYHRDPAWKTGPDAVHQLADGMEKHEADFGWAVTCGSFSKEAEDEAERLLETRGHRIRLIDGEELAKLVVEIGMSEVQTQWSLAGG